jgi:hypothetical protein
MTNRSGSQGADKRPASPVIPDEERGRKAAPLVSVPPRPHVPPPVPPAAPIQPDSDDPPKDAGPPPAEKQS